MAGSFNYQGEEVYIGIDVHKRYYSVCAVHESRVVRRGRILARYEVLVDYLSKHFSGAQVYTAYEAGFSGFGLHRYLESRGFKSRVVNAASIEVGARDRVKTDKRDSTKIAVQLAAGRLEGIRVPSLEQEHRRLLTRTREQLVQDKTRVGLRIKNRLFQFGLIGPDEKISVGEKLFEKHVSESLPPELRRALDYLISQWRYLAEQLKQMRRDLEDQAKEDWELEKIYRSVPGVGPVGARILANELGDMSQFKNEGRIFSFVGFTTTERSSGDSRRQGHISRQGSSRLRWILTEAAWRAIRLDPVLRETYLRIAGKAGGKKAIVAIARKLIGRIRACFNKQQTYQLAYVG